VSDKSWQGTAIDPFAVSVKFNVAEERRVQHLKSPVQPSSLNFPLAASIMAFHDFNITNPDEQKLITLAGCSLFLPLFGFMLMLGCQKKKIFFRSEIIFIKNTKKGRKKAMKPSCCTLFGSPRKVLETVFVMLLLAIDATRCGGIFTVLLMGRLFPFPFLSDSIIQF
jgi:hypothetical protein